MATVRIESEDDLRKLEEKAAIDAAIAGIGEAEASAAISIGPLCGTARVLKDGMELVKLDDVSPDALADLRAQMDAYIGKRAAEIVASVGGLKIQLDHPPMPKPPRRIADYVISDEAFFTMLGGHKGHWLKLEMPDVPADARFCAVHYCFNRGAFMVRFESAEFERVLEGCEVPIRGELVLQFRREDAVIPVPPVEASIPVPPADSQLRQACVDVLGYLSERPCLSPAQRQDAIGKLRASLAESR